MKKFYVFLILFLVLSCNDDVDASVVGDWLLVEVLVDPGDGSGVFNRVSSDKMISFQSDGTVTSNGIICGIDTETNTPSVGTYSEEDLFFETDACGIPNQRFTFEITGSTLTFFAQCIEACGVRYRKL